MTVEVPCRLGERFAAVGGGDPYLLTEISFYKWDGYPAGNVNVGTRERWKRGRMTTQTIYARQRSAEVRYTIELPDRLVTGCPLRELGLDTDAVGRLQAIRLEDHGKHRYIIYYGMEPGSAPDFVRTEELDRIFREVLPRRAVDIDLKNYF